MEDYELNDHPQTLRNAFSYLESSSMVLNTSDTFIVFLYILMLETGFVPKEFAGDAATDCGEFCYPRILKLTERLPTKWKLDRSYYINFVLPCLPNDICKFFCIVAGEDILATCTIQDSKIGYSFLFDPSVYIVDNNTRLFQNLRGLSIKFKDSISYPLKSFVLSMYNIPHNSLLYLPYEVVLCILRYVDKYDIRNVSRASRMFENIDKDPKLRHIMNKNEGYPRANVRLLNHYDFM